MTRPHPPAILSRLKGVRPTGNGWTALCPAHEDQHNSLSVGVGTDGRILLNCHAQKCPYDAIARACGTTVDELMGAPQTSATNGRKAPTIVATYDYRDEGRAVLFQVCRLDPKDFRQRRPSTTGSGWTCGTTGVRRVIYRLDELAEVKRVWWCYAPDTDVLTPDGWLAFPDLTDVHQVAQYDPATGGVAFVRPRARQRIDYDGPMISARSQWCDLLVTPNHRLLAHRPRCRPRELTAAEATHTSSPWLLPSAGFHDGEDTGPTPTQAAIIAAYCADGHVPRGFPITFNLKKRRKKDRLRILLSRAEIAWTEQAFPSCPEWTLFSIDRRLIPWLLMYAPDKRWDWSALRWPLASRRAAIEELQHWDGDSTHAID